MHRHQALYAGLAPEPTGLEGRKMEGPPSPVDIRLEEKGFDKKQVGLPRQVDDPPGIVGFVDGVSDESDFLTWNGAKNPGLQLTKGHHAFMNPFSIA